MSIHIRFRLPLLLNLPIDCYPETTLVDNHPEKGFRLIYNNDGRFHAIRLINDCVIAFRLQNQDYQDYLDLCMKQKGLSQNIHRNLV